MSIGLPYFVLSATGPLLQAWFARAFPGRIPYRLYALSNIGSLLALASYPFFFEPAFDLPRQAQFWTAGFVFYAVLCAYIAWRIAPVGQVVPDNSRRSQGQPDVQQPPRPARYLFWLILAAFASVMLIATTNHISTDIAVMPLLWVVPLALYLITFIIAFDRPTWYRRIPVALLAIVSIYAAATTHHFGGGRSFLYDLGTIGLVASLFGDPNGVPPTFELSANHFLISNFVMLFAVCLFCHGEIVRTRPTPRYLTSFYLMISAGRALGGIFATLIAPLLFNRYFEWDAALYIACVVALVVVARACISLVTRRVRQRRGTARRPPADYAPLACTVIVLLLISLDVLVDVSELLGSRIPNVRWTARDFFGTLTVQQLESDDQFWQRNVLFHGTTIHGSQYTNETRRREATTYYGKQTGIGRAIEYFHRHLPPEKLRLAVVGLGTGTLATYLDAGDSITLYEINPTVIKLTESGEWFTYLRDARARGAHYDIRPGDARLTLQHEIATNKPLTYHVLALDAFSGDAVPAHLLTTQAFELYLKSLAPAADANGKPIESGAIAVHVSNRYLDLEPVVRAAALRFNLFPMRFHTPEEPGHDAAQADWIILTRNAGMTNELRNVATPVVVTRPPVLWTDDRSSLFEILR